ncbi:MAG: CatB-related O-acetyltransferase [Planctomycetota bacterium]
MSRDATTWMRRSAKAAWVRGLIGDKRMQRSERLATFALRRMYLAEGGPEFSLTARDVMREAFNLKIGDYSRNGCFEARAFPQFTTIGRYCSIAKGVRAISQNHPADGLSSHSLFYNKKHGFGAGYEPLDYEPLTIGHDVWIGHGVTITAGVTVGTGAVIGAGSVVTKPVEAFTIVGGNPAKPIRDRYAEGLRDRVEQSRWWLRPASQLLPFSDVFSGSLDAGKLDRLMDELGPAREEAGGDG